MGLAYYRYPTSASFSWRANRHEPAAYICQGRAQRQANGELTARAIAMLPNLTGNVGINGGDAAPRINLHHHH